MLNKASDTDRLDKAIVDLENTIIALDPENDTDKIDKMVSMLEKLYKLRNGEKPSKTELKDWVPLIGSIGGVLVIVLFEAFGHTLTTKALSFIQKPKG